MSMTTTLLPVGGLGEFGRNCLVVETERDLLLVDCGSLFGPSELPGVEYAIPDFRYVMERREKFRGVLLTHGHEDHVGALAHLMAQCPGPVYGTRFTLGLVRQRLAEVNLRQRGLLCTVDAGDAVDLGDVRAHFLSVAHSIPDACAVALETPGGVILHSGDFNFDPAPVGDQRTDEAALAVWGRRGVDLLCCDSTNALEGQATRPSGEVAAGFGRVFPTVAGRVYVALFSSNVARMQQVVEVSRRCGRRVAPLGRSVVRSGRLARQIGCLRTAPGDWVAESRARGLPRSSLTVVCGGTQAEPGSALWRIAHGLEPHHSLQPGDAVLYSARAIPGNEKAIHALLDLCAGAGARVYFGADDGIHVSGHPGAPDLARMLRLTRPRCVLPVHGTLRHLMAAGEVARADGWPPERVLVGTNGCRVLLEGGLARRGEPLSVGGVCVEGTGCYPEDHPILTARRRMGAQGVALALLDDGSRASSVQVILCGVVPGEENVLAREAEAEVLAALDESSGGEAAAEDRCRVAEQSLRRFFRRRQGLRPYVLARPRR